MLHKRSITDYLVWHLLLVASFVIQGLPSVLLTVVIGCSITAITIPEIKFTFAQWLISTIIACVATDYLTPIIIKPICITITEYIHCVMMNRVTPPVHQTLPTPTNATCDTSNDAAQFSEAYIGTLHSYTHVHSLDLI